MRLTEASGNFQMCLLNQNHGLIGAVQYISKYFPIDHSQEIEQCKLNIILNNFKCNFKASGRSTQIMWHIISHETIVENIPSLNEFSALLKPPKWYIALVSLFQDIWAGENLIGSVATWTHLSLLPWYSDKPVRGFWPPTISRPSSCPSTVALTIFPEKWPV